AVGLGFAFVLFNCLPTAAIHALSLHDALPIWIADIEDLIANSLGAWIGALVAPVLSRLGVPLFTREARPAGHLGGSSPWNDAAWLPPSAAEVGHDAPMGQVGEAGADEQERGAGEADR